MRTDRPNRGAVVAPVETEPTITPDAADEVAKRERKPVDVGTVTVGVSTREITSNRTSKLDSNPVALAVRDAEEGKQYDISYEEGKGKAVLSVLRRAGTHFRRGVNILQDKDNVITFGVSARRVRKPAVTPGADTVPTDAAPGQWAGPTQPEPTE